MKKIKLLLPITALSILPASIAPAMTSCGKPKEFATDSWNTVIKTCNKGFVAFAKAYCDYDGSNETEAIASIKEWIHTQDNARYMDITIGKYQAQATVRVIDVNHDKLSDKKGNAKFTFEFADIIDVSLFDINDNLWVDPWGQDDKEEDSILRAYMNGYMLDFLPKVVRENLKHVDKVTAVSSNDGEYQTHTSSDLMFPLSCCEFNATFNGDVEGTKYEYYRNGISEFETQDPLRVKNYMGTYTPFGYWTRSAVLDSPASICGVVYDGGIHDQYSFQGGLGVAPAFCI